MSETGLTAMELPREFVLEPFWHHGTKRTGWLEQAQRDDARVHIGTPRAARSRMMKLYHRPRLSFEWHQLRVHSGASICPRLSVDPHSSTVEHRGELASLESDWDVVAYLNEHEDEGSISLSVRARVLEPDASAHAVMWYLFAPAPLRRRFAFFRQGWSSTRLYLR